MPSIIPANPWGRKIAYELIYAWPFGSRLRMFNPGFLPVEPLIANKPLFAGNESQIQLYAELLKTARFDAETWSRHSVLEIGAGCGGGLFYLQERYKPRSVVGIDISSVAARRGKMLGIDIRCCDALQMPFEDQSFDCIVCVDTLVQFPMETFLREIRRVMNDEAIILIAHTFHTTLEAMEREFKTIARRSNLKVELFGNATEGVRRSIIESAEAKEKFVAKFPSIIRNRFSETLYAKGSQRYKSWLAREAGHAFVIFKKKN